MGLLKARHAWQSLSRRPRPRQLAAGHYKEESIYTVLWVSGDLTRAMDTRSGEGQPSGHQETAGTQEQGLRDPGTGSYTQRDSGVRRATGSGLVTVRRQE